MTPIPFHSVIMDDLFLDSELKRYPEISSRTVVVGECAGELVFRCLGATDRAVLFADPLRQDMTKVFHQFFHADGTQR